MPQDGMRFVRLFELLDFLGGKLDVEGGDGLIEVIHFGRADDRTVDIGIMQDPGKSDLRAGHAALLCHVRHMIGHGEILVAEVQPFRKRIAFGA